MKEDNFCKEHQTYNCAICNPSKEDMEGGVEDFENCMGRVFTSSGGNTSWESMNRLDLFRLLFDDQQKKYLKIKRSNKFLQQASSELVTQNVELRAQNEQTVLGDRIKISLLETRFDQIQNLESVVDKKNKHITHITGLYQREMQWRAKDRKAVGIALNAMEEFVGDEGDENGYGSPALIEDALKEMREVRKI